MNAATVKTEQQYMELVMSINSRFPATNAMLKVIPSAWGGGFEIKVSKMEHAKALREMYKGFSFKF